MKNYKEKNIKHHFFNENKYLKCYFYKELYHGLYSMIYNEKDKLKGYYNMDEEYGHWEECNDFNYYL